MVSSPSTPSAPLCAMSVLSKEILLTILEKLMDASDRKSWSLVCRYFYALESQHRKGLKPRCSDFLPSLLGRYRNIQCVDFSLCPRVSDESLLALSRLCRSTLASVNLSQPKFFTHVGISQLTVNCSSLVGIDISNGTHLTDVAAEAISKARNLQTLRMGRCKRITDLGIGCIAVGCSKLRTLGLKWCLGIGDLGIGLVAIKCKELRSLDLSYVQITEACIASLVQLEYLEDLILVGCFGIDDDGLKVLKKGCKSLKALDMSNCQNISPSGLSYLANGATSLQQLTLAYCTHVSDSLTYSLRNLPKLQCIRLDGCQVTCSGLKGIGECCTSLRELSLCKCKGVTDDGLCSLLAKHKELKKLDITCCRKITCLSVVAIAKCKQLSSLKMESCSSVSKESFKLIGEQLHLLEELDFTENEFNDEGLRSFTRCSELTSLKIGICSNITNSGLIHISGSCQKLIELDLYRVAAVDDTGIGAIAHNCPMLQKVNMSYCTRITDDSLKFLSTCQWLSELEHRGCPLVSSAGLAALAVGCRLICKLDIKKCNKIGDKGILQLGRFSQNLKQASINLSYCSVGDVGLLALPSMGCLQNLNLLHMGGVSAQGLEIALLSCACLRNVKLNAHFRSLLSPQVLEHMEARGCTFQWRDKPFML
ncbi:F-box/LRR-repeat protein 3 [Nymphaea thermarum]|nr:F-box/LRR-repeat protein 3 [Nymphaea thermarum]